LAIVSSSKFKLHSEQSRLLLEQGFSIGKSSVHRYGSKLEEQMESIAETTEAAKYLIESIPDDEGSVNEAVLRLATPAPMMMTGRDEGMCQSSKVASGAESRDARHEEGRSRKVGERRREIKKAAWWPLEVINRRLVARFTQA